MQQWHILKNYREYEILSNLFLQFYNTKFSISFLACIDEQLTSWLLNFLSLENQQMDALQDCLYWEFNKPLNYRKGEISSIYAALSIVYIFRDLKIIWYSKTGKIYEPSDEIIDTQDIVFSIEGLDKELYLYYKFPDGTLYYPIYHYINEFKVQLNLEVSVPFMQIANKQLTQDYIRITGIAKMDNVSVSPLSAGFKLFFPDLISVYSKGTVSSLAMLAGAVDTVFMNKVVYLCWRSISGKIYDISDTEIDDNDIVFWFEGIDPMIIYNRLYPKEPFPLKIKTPSFEFEYVRMEVDAQIDLYFKPEYSTIEETIIEDVDTFIQNKCMNSYIKINKQYEGRVHKFYKKQVENLHWQYNIDTGSAGVYFVKKFVEYFNKKNCLQKMKIE